MKESDLYPPLRDWLTERGYENHVEVFGHDVVALKDEKATVIELKTCLSGTLLTQCLAAANWADFVYAAIGTRHRSSKMLRYYGIGLLYVNPTTGKVREWCKPRPQPDLWHRRRKYRIGELTGRLPAQHHELAGLPSSPALSLQRAIRQAVGASR